MVNQPAGPWKPKQTQNIPYQIHQPKCTKDESRGLKALLEHDYFNIASRIKCEATLPTCSIFEILFVGVL